MIQIYESKRKPKPIAAQLAPKTKQSSTLVDRTYVPLHSIEDCDESPTPNLSNKVTPVKTGKIYLKTAEDLPPEIPKLKIKEQTNEEKNLFLAQLFYETR